MDTAYVSEQGVEEVMDRAPEILRHVRYVEEKRIMQDFLYEIGHDTGLATYGEKEVKQCLETGRVKTLLLSEALSVVRVTVKCTACNYVKQETIRNQEVLEFEQSLSGQPCSNCKALTLQLAEVKEVIDELAELAEQTGTDVEIISIETEEGQMLKNSFGGIAAILRFKLSN